MATPFTVKYPPKKTTPVTPINQSRVSASTAPNMSMAPKAAPAPVATKPTGLQNLANAFKPMLAPFAPIAKGLENPINAIKPVTAPIVNSLMPAAPKAPQAPIAPFGGKVAPELLTPKVEEQKNKQIPQNPPSKTKIAIDNTPPPTPPVPAPYPSGIMPGSEADKAAQAAATTPATTLATTPDTSKTDAVAATRAANIKALQDRYTASLGQSQEEIDAQRQLDNLVASKELGVQAASEQPIEMGFITGQQKNMTERAAVQAEPLKARLAALQAKRTAEAAQAKAAYEEATGQGATKPTEVGGNLVQLNPETGKYEAVYTAPASAADNKPIALSEGQKLVDPTTGKEIATGNEKTASPTADMQNYEFAKKNGYAGTFDQFIKQSGGGSDPQSYKEWQLAGQPGTYENWLATKGGTAIAPGQGNTELKTSALQSAKDLLASFGKNKWAVGGTSMLPVLPGTDAANFVVQFNNLKSLLSLDNVKYLKGQGQVSDAERRLLEQASAKLDRSQSEEEFAKSLDDIITALSGTGTQGMTDNEFATQW